MVRPSIVASLIHAAAWHMAPLFIFLPCGVMSNAGSAGIGEPCYSLTVEPSDDFGRPPGGEESRP